MRFLKIFILFIAAHTLTGCQKPCEQLNKLVCNEISQTSPKLCTLFRQETSSTDISKRQCMALVETWPKHGKKQIQALNERYIKYKKWVNRNYKALEASDRFDKAELSIRFRFRKLLKKSMHKTAPAKRRKPKKRKKKRTKRRTKKRK